MIIGILKIKYRRYAKWAPATFFALGFLFDIITLGRIDSWGNVLREGIFLALAGTFICLEFMERAGVFEPSPKIERFWKYREALVHFFLGSLISSHLLFYFKSASIFSSFFFVAGMTSLLVANEFERFKNLGVSLRMAIFSLCLASYFIYAVPIIMRFIGIFPFIIAIVISALILLRIYDVLRRQTSDEHLVKRQVLFPSAGVLLALIILYFFHLIPPVPLSVHYMGIYHSISKKDGKYHLSYSRPRWKFWQHGAQSYAYRSGDQLVGFVSIFSPHYFKDRIQVRWLLKEEKTGWTTQDVIPFKIVGGRDDGYRGYTIKRNFQPGHWRFQVETTDGREIGRLYLTVFKDESSQPRQMHEDIY